jgi:hypothetical protein
MYSRILRIGIDARGAEGFARSLVGCLADEIGLQATLLYGLDSSGSLRLRDSHGFGREITQGFLAPDLFETLPMGQAIRSTTTVVVTREEVLETVSRVRGEILPFDLYVHIPCRSLDAPIGGIALALSGPNSDRELPESFLNVLATVGAARLNQLSLAELKAA